MGLQHILSCDMIYMFANALKACSWRTRRRNRIVEDNYLRWDVNHHPILGCVLLLSTAEVDMTCHGSIMATSNHEKTAWRIAPWCQFTIALNMFPSCHEIVGMKQYIMCFTVGNPTLTNKNIHLPSGNLTIAVENGPVEMTCSFPGQKWWICPSFFVCSPEGILSHEIPSENHHVPMVLSFPMVFPMVFLWFS